MYCWTVEISTVLGKKGNETQLRYITEKDILLTEIIYLNQHFCCRDLHLSIRVS